MKKQFCTFRLKDRLFGVNILDVKEINPETKFTPIFHAPKEIKGMVNIRGKIHLILDLRLILGFDAQEPDEFSRIILFKPHAGEFFGVLVDRIGDVLVVDEACIEDRRQGGAGKTGGVERRQRNIGVGVCKLKQELMVILDAGNFLSAVSGHR